MNSKEDVFTSIQLPSSLSVEVIDGRGEHYFKAMADGRGDTGQMIRSLIVQLVRIDGNQVTGKYVDDMEIRDVVRLVEVVSTMMDSYF